MAGHGQLPQPASGHLAGGSRWQLRDQAEHAWPFGPGQGRLARIAQCLLQIGLVPDPDYRARTDAGLREQDVLDLPRVLAFGVVNRAYFAASVSDRGEEFFAQFPGRYSALLAEQEAGVCAFYVLVADDGSVLGRFKLYDIEDGTARVGYRVAQQVAGHGVATRSVRELCRIAAVRHGCALRAATSHDNAASQKVLAKAGFVPVGPATPTTPADLGGKSGTWYQRDLQP